MKTTQQHPDRIASERKARRGVWAAGVIVWLAGTLAGPVHAQFRVGFMGPMSGPLGITGQELKRGFDLALEHLGGRIGGQDTVVSYANDQGSPSIAVSEFARLIDKDRIDVLVGIAASNVAMAVSQPAANAGVTVLLAHAGPNDLAGKGCMENVFGIGHQNEQFGEAIGRYIKQAGAKSVFAMGLDYQAGWEMVDAVQAGLGAPVSGKALTAMSQVDFAPELARVREAKPDALFAFYPGSAAVAFVRQYAGSGIKSQVPLYSVGAIADSLVIRAQGDAALGVVSANTWNANVRNSQNDRFTSEFRAKNAGRDPTTFSAQAYDTVMYLDAALRQTQGAKDPKVLRAALRDNKGFKSIRGTVKLNTNQFIIQDMVIQRVEKDEKNGFQQKLIATIPAVGDRFAADCRLK
ncbi:ABC transporter substrate-binding protein [Aquabacterium sp. J223]|uniref:ABC transporter substrate-binding protein n=1 Tax=Aquabacterium sp. J223 TaxID=2898431 RepID=UPI0021AD542E|nr:ABC transporter substrate-binding protein [Aquabacterium sp. J223]UUX95283.1 ABC transporter substrate-binding protein [Aquabacterium sp. J223]